MECTYRYFWHWYLEEKSAFVTFEVFSTIYSTLVQPYFDYCNVVWGNCDKSLETKLQKLQNCTSRILTFSPYDASIDNLFTSLAWKKLEAQWKIHTVSMVYKSLNGLTLQYLNSLSSYRNEVSSYSLRDSKDMLAIPLPRTNYVKNSFSYRGLVLRNSLPIELRQAKTLSAFKHGCSDLF